MAASVSRSFISLTLGMAAKYVTRLISQLFFCQNNFRPSFHIWFQPLASRILTLADVLQARPLRVIDRQDARQDASSLVPGASSVSRSGLRLRPTWRKCHVVVSN